MKIILDTEVMKKRGGIDQMLYLLSLFAGCPISIDTFESARQKNLLKFNQPYDRRFPMPKNLELSETGKYTVESTLAACSNTNETEEKLFKLAEKLQELFPDGIKPGYAYKWRDNTSCIADRLGKFFLKYKASFDRKGIDYSDEAIIKATKAYVDSFNGNYQYMQLLKYFIWKNKVTGEKVERGRIVGEVERQSQLAAWLEDTEDKSINHDWDVALR